MKKITGLVSFVLIFSNCFIPEHALAMVNGTVDCQTGQAVSTNNFSVNVDNFTNYQTIAADSISPDWHNTSAQVNPNSYWTTNPTKYLVPDNSNNFLLQSKTCSQDMEVSTWMRNGYAILRYNQATGTGIYFSHNGETTEGRLEIGILTGGGENSYLQGNFYTLYNNMNLVGTVPGYTRAATDGQYFTFGVSGFDIYAKYNGVEFIHFKDYRDMLPGSAVIKTNTGYGFRNNFSLEHLAPVNVYSDYENNSFDLRDFGLKDTQTSGSIAAGSNQLNLSSASSLVAGDNIIVELGGEAGSGLRGTVGVGGTWPKQNYPNLTAMQADTSQPANTFAWLQTDGSVYQWYNSTWVARDASQYYTNKVYPLALMAKVTNVSADGLTLTLDKAASVAANNANVYYDNKNVFKKFFRSPRYDAGLVDEQLTDARPITPQNTTIILPSGNFATSEVIKIEEDHIGWSVNGAGQTSTKIFSPKGVRSASILIYTSSVTVQNLKLQGNAKNNGFALDTTETSIDTYPPGIVFLTSSNGRVYDVTVNDVFQDAVGTEYGHNTWAERVTASSSEGLRQYVQWMFQWADSDGGGCIDCTVSSPTLMGGFESFRSTGTEFLRPTGTNVVAAFNSAGNFLFQDANLTFLAGSNAGNSWYSPFGPIINVNTNISGGYADLGGVIQNATMIQQGFINGPGDPNHDNMSGIVINENNPNVSILGGFYSAPDYTTPSIVHGAIGINSTASNLLVDGIRVIGSTDGWGNIALTNGLVKNCVADSIVPHGPNPSVTIENCQTNAQYSDPTPPSVPTNLTATPVSTSQINLSWSASTDNVGVAGYKIYRNGSLLQSTTATNYSDNGLTQGTSYSYTVAAFDAVGNMSVQSAPASATTLAPDTTPPVISNVGANTITSTTARIVWNTNESADSTVNFGTASNKLTSVVSSMTLVTAHSLNLTGLKKNTTYYYKVASKDGSGNQASSQTLSFKTLK